MTLEQHLIIHLRAMVTALGTRIYRAGQLYTNTMPALTIQRISSVPFYTHQGECDAAVSTLQLNVYHTTLADLDSLVSDVRTAMKHFSTSGDGGRARLINMLDLGFNSDAKLFAVSLEYQLIHR